MTSCGFAQKRRNKRERARRWAILAFATQRVKHARERALRFEDLNRSSLGSVQTSGTQLVVHTMQLPDIG